MLRRRFVNWLLGGAGGALLGSILYPIARFISPPEVPETSTNQVEAGATNDPAFLDRGFKIVRFGSEPVIVIRVSESEYRAFAATCTHLDCIVEFQRDHRRIWCNCHNGEYNLQGVPVAGPPPRPLETFRVDLTGGGDGAAPRVVVSRT